MKTPKKYSSLESTVNCLIVVVALVGVTVTSFQSATMRKIDTLLEELNKSTYKVTVPLHLRPTQPLPNLYSRETFISSDTPQLVAKQLPEHTSGRFKTYMDYRTITDKSSAQWQLQQAAVTDFRGFRRYDGKYMVAVGTYYASRVGTELSVKLSSGAVIDVVVGDIKQNKHTDATNRFVIENGNIIEFIVDSEVIDPLAKRLGDVSVLGLAGGITKIEEVVR